MEKKFSLSHGKSGAVISVRVSTRSPRAELAGIMDDGTIKVRLTSAPVDGKANEELFGLLAKLLGIPKTNLEIISGQTSKTKLIAIYGIDSDSVNRIINRVIAND